MAKKTILVTQYVDVEYDESRFTPEWMEEFRGYMYPSFKTVDHHLKHLAQMEARGLCSHSFNPEVEGYGVLSEMGIKLKVTDQEEEVLD